MFTGLAAGPKTEEKSGLPAPGASWLARAWNRVVELNLEPGLIVPGVVPPPAPPGPKAPGMRFGFGLKRPASGDRTRFEAKGQWQPGGRVSSAGLAKAAVTIALPPFSRASIQEGPCSDQPHEAKTRQSRRRLAEPSKRKGPLVDGG